MAYNADGLKLIAPGGAIEASFPTAGGVKSLYHYVTNDTLAQVLANAYFDDIAGDPLLAGDVILAVIDADGTPTAVKLLVTVGGGDVTVVPVSQGDGPDNGVVGSASANLSFGLSEIGTGTGTAFSLPTPVPGAVVEVVQGGTATGGRTFAVSSSGVTLDASGKTTITINGEGQGFRLYGASASRWRITNLDGATLS